MISTLPSSEGWIWKKPTSIQRREPRAALPRINTSTIEPIKKA